jgi:hypothetical protein
MHLLSEWKMVTGRCTSHQTLQGWQLAATRVKKRLAATQTQLMARVTHRSREHGARRR